MAFKFGKRFGKGFDTDKALDVTGKCAKTAGGVLRVIGKVLLTALLIILTTGLMFTCVFAIYVKNNLSSKLDVTPEEYAMQLSTILYYKDSSSGDYKELATLYGTKNRIWVEYENLPKALEHAAVAIEDKRFYQHSGVDWFRTASALKNMFFGSSTYGASTITQQLIKNVTQYDDVTVERKLLEIFRALEFESKYSKEQIMEWYLNSIYLGEGCWGVGTAALNYFGKSVGDLTVAECALLVGITNNPSAYDPYEYPEWSIERQQDILYEMYKQNYLTKAEYDEACAQELVFKRVTRSQSISTEYSWFVDAAIEDVIEALMEYKDIPYATAEDLLFNGGYKIYTTADLRVQAAVDAVYSDYANMPEGYSASETQQLQSAMIILDPYTGDIVAMAGKMGEKEGNRIFNYATDMLRPPGSTIKPLSVYGAGIEMGYFMPYTLVNDAADIVLDGTDWYPDNDNFLNSGIITIRYAIQRSINTIAAQIIDRITPQRAYDFLVTRFGFTTLADGTGGISDAAYAPMALGQLSYGVSLEEMASAYTAFVNKGIYTDSRTFSHIYDADGNLILENVPESHVALKETTAYYMTDLMESVMYLGTGAIARLDNMPTAGKSGGAGDWTDRWFVGYTPYYIGVVWCGYEIPEYMGPSNPSAILWKNVMKNVHDPLPYKDFNMPDGMKQYTICEDTGLLATEACKHDIRGDHTQTIYLLQSEAPTSYCECHVVISICSESQGLIGDDCPASCHTTGAVIDRSKAKTKILDADYITSEGEIRPYFLDEMVSCTHHRYDSGTGWLVDYLTGFLYMPDSRGRSILYDPATRKVYDSYTKMEIDVATGALINTETGELIDPYLGTVYAGPARPVIIPVNAPYSPRPVTVTPSPTPRPNSIGQN